MWDWIVFVPDQCISSYFDYQHGFGKRRSCETQLITTIYDLAIGLDRRQQVYAIFIGVKEGF